MFEITTKDPLFGLTRVSTSKNPRAAASFARVSIRSLLREGR
jgi:hypothetical protein